MKKLSHRPTGRAIVPSLKTLRTLREVARLGSFSAAGEALGLSQPAVSNQIRQLEQQVGCALLDRAGKATRLTPEGELLIAATSRALGEVEAAVDEIRRQRAVVSGALVLAAGATAIKHLLPAVMADLRARHPAIDLRLITGNTSEMIPGLLDGSIDLGLLTGPIRHAPLQSRFFYRDRLVCITPAMQAPAAVARRAMLKNRNLVLFDRGGSIRQAINEWLGLSRKAAVHITDIGSADAQSAFVRAGFGWSIVSEIAVREEAAEKKIDIMRLDPPLARDLVLVWHAERAAKPVIAAALDVFAAHAANATR